MSATSPDGLRRRRRAAEAADDEHNDDRGGATAAAAAADAAADADATAAQSPPQSLQSPSYLPLLFPLLLFIITLLSALVVSHGAPNPYMDEIFHVPQTRRLCEHGFPAGLRGDSWDPKITTFPGLYVLGAAYAWLQAGVLRLSRAVNGDGGAGGATQSFAAVRAALCGEAGALRGLNGLLLALCFFPAYAVRMGVLGRGARRGGRRREGEDAEKNNNNNENQKDALGTSLAAAVLLPTHFFFGFLYYTDVGALLFLLLAAQALQEWAQLVQVNGGASTAIAAAITATASGAAAIAMRQTNAVWYAFLVGAALLRVAYGRMRAEKTTGLGPITTAPFRALAALGRQAGSSTSFLAHLLLLFTPPAAFVAFVLFVNGGNVALGDHDAHDAASTRHWAHPFYAAAFCAFMAGGPFFLRPEALGRLVRRFFVVAAGRSTTKSKRRREDAGSKKQQRLSPLALSVALAVVAAAVAAAHFGTLAHPYLLADNRHYTFYAWRRTLGRHWVARYAFAPVGAVAVLLLGSELVAGVVGGGGGEGQGDDAHDPEEGVLWVLGFAAACVLTLVPSGLIEPRYYTVPAVLAMLHAPARRRDVAGGGSGASAAAIDWSALVACSAFSLINAATLYVFAFRPFQWPDGSTARFMW